MNLTTITNTPDSLTMSSKEIAELTGKEHRNVLADIRNMLAQLGLGSAEFSAHLTNPQNGQNYPIFALPKDLTITLVAGYSVVMRHRIVTRWQELEAKQSRALPNFTDPAEAALAWAATPTSSALPSARGKYRATQIN